MGFLDQISKSISQGVDRAKFEAEKFQKTMRLQNELNDLTHQINEKWIEMGQRAYELHRAGQITAPSIIDLTQKVDQLRSNIVLKEEELKQAQAEIFIETPQTSSSQAQSVPIDHEPEEKSNITPEKSDTRICPTCNFRMPSSAMFCPSCGMRVGT